MGVIEDLTGVTGGRLGRDICLWLFHSTILFCFLEVSFFAQSEFSYGRCCGTSRYIISWLENIL